MDTVEETEKMVKHLDDLWAVAEQEIEAGETQTLEAFLADCQTFSIGTRLGMPEPLALA